MCAAPGVQAVFRNGNVAIYHNDNMIMRGKRVGELNYLELFTRAHAYVVPLRN